MPFEMYYITAGKINQHALDDPVNVSAAINTIHFTWESLDSAFLVGNLVNSMMTFTLNYYDSLILRRTTDFHSCLGVCRYHILETLKCQTKKYYPYR